IQATVSSETSNIAVEIAGDKEDTKYLLEQAEIPVPKGKIIRNEKELDVVLKQLGFPLVTKPINGNHGRGITVNIKNPGEALEGFKTAQKVSGSVIDEKFVTGDDYRLLVINHVLVAAAKRTPAHVTGDGKQSIQQLIDEVNRDPRRGYGHEKVLTQITVNELTRNLITAKGYNLDTVLKEGKIDRKSVV